VEEKYQRFWLLSYTNKFFKSSCVFTVRSVLNNDLFW